MTLVSQNGVKNAPGEFPTASLDITKNKKYMYQVFIQNSPVSATDAKVRVKNNSRVYLSTVKMEHKHKNPTTSAVASAIKLKSDVSPPPPPPLSVPCPN